MEELLSKLKELLDLQSAPVEERAKRQAREKIIECLTMDHELNWQCVATPYDIVNEMLDLIPNDAEKFIVFFSLEFLEEMVKTRGIAPESILFIGDNDMESAVAGNKDMYGVHTGIMSKDNGYQDGKLIFPEIIFNFLKSEDMNMKFGKLAVIANFPYQIQTEAQKGRTGGKQQAKPIYNLFIESVIDNLNPDHLVSINPSKWMTGGFGLDKHRERMMNDGRMKKIVHFGGDKEIFPTVSIKGGVNYFLWEKDYNGKCEFVNGDGFTNRFLNQYDIIIQNNNAIEILDKVTKVTTNWIDRKAHSRGAFGIKTNFSDWDVTGLKCIVNGKTTKFVDSSKINDRDGILTKWKVCTSKACGDGTLEKLNLLVWILEPNAIASDTYMIVNEFDSKLEAENFMSYMKTKFFRFMLGLRVSTQDINKPKFAFVPDLEDYSAPWTDKELYAKYNLTRQQVAYIESKIKEIK
jgi:site-specific DNA-methyltransferase (adenine-specific)